MTSKDASVFQQELAKYRAYSEYLSGDSGIISMSAQCLAETQVPNLSPFLTFPLRRAS